MESGGLFSKRESRRRRLLERDGEDCWYCGVSLGDDITIEHLIARTRQGADAIDNLALAHMACNIIGSNRALVQKIEIRIAMRAGTFFTGERKHARQLSPSLPGEEWRSCDGLPGYEVSNFGRIARSLEYGARSTLQGRCDKDGSRRVSLTINGVTRNHSVGRLTLTAWIGPAPSAQHHACFLNGDKNDTMLDNLAWKTRMEISDLIAERGTRCRGERHSRAKLTEQAVRQIRASPLSCAALAKEYGVTDVSISNVRTGRSWRHAR